MPKLTASLAKSHALYQYHDCFFFILQNIDEPSLVTLSSAISEFAVSVEASDLILHKIKEYGKLVTDQAIHTDF